jgi:hypothetical protein
LGRARNSRVTGRDVTGSYMRVHAHGQGAKDGSSNTVRVNWLTLFLPSSKAVKERRRQ